MNLDKYQKEAFFDHLADNEDLGYIIKSFCFSEGMNVDLITAQSPLVVALVCDYITLKIARVCAEKHLVTLTLRGGLDPFFASLHPFQGQNNRDKVFVVDCTSLDFSDDIATIFSKINAMRNTILAWLNAPIVIILPREIARPFAFAASDIWSLKKFVAHVDSPFVTSEPLPRSPDVTVERERLHEENKVLNAMLRENPDREVQRLLWINLIETGRHYETYGRLGDTLTYYHQALALAVENSAKRPDSLEAARDVSVSLSNVAQIYLQQGHVQTALEKYEESLTLRKTLHAKRPDSLQAARDVSVSLNNVAQIYLQQGHVQTALETYEEAYRLIENIPDLGNGDFDNLRNYLKKQIEKTGNPHSTILRKIVHFVQSTLTKVSEFWK